MTDNKGQPIFLTADRSIHRGQKLDPTDMEILNAVNSGNGLVTIKTIHQLEKLAKAANRAFTKSRKLVRRMTQEQATVIRKLRVDEGYSWRAIARACYDLGWGEWEPPSNQIVGMAICERAAKFFDENYLEPPWN